MSEGAELAKSTGIAADKIRSLYADKGSSRWRKNVGKLEGGIGGSLPLFHSFFPSSFHSHRPWEKGQLHIRVAPKSVVTAPRRQIEKVVMAPA